MARTTFVLILYFRMVAHGTNSADVEGTRDSGVEDLFCGASPRSVPSLFFSSYPFSLECEPVHDDYKHDLTCPHSGVAYIWLKAVFEILADIQDIDIRKSL